MNSAPSPKTHKSISLMILNTEKKLFKLKLSVISDKLEIYITNDFLISLSYKLNLQIEDFNKLNKFFRQFDSVEEIFDFIIDIEKLEEKINILIEDKFAKLKIIIPSISKTKKINEIEIMIPGIEVKESDLILKLCEKVEKINILEKKINYIFDFMGKTEKDFELYEEMKNSINNNIKNIESNIIKVEDFATVAMGIKKNLDKTIKEARLLYRASRDGDSTQFHSKCDGKENTVTFVKSKNGRRFGGFANKGFHSSNSWISDPKSFVFSLDFHECYYYNNSGYMIYGSSSYGPLWGAGHDLYLASGCLSNTTSSTNQKSFEYNGRNNALSGGTNFQAEDYETYELILE